MGGGVVRVVGEYVAFLCVSALAVRFKNRRGGSYIEFAYLCKKRRICGLSLH